jgi:cyclopropane fatty-acyl-phospholipid synthase-like methyltransferase
MNQNEAIKIEGNNKKLLTKLEKGLSLNKKLAQSKRHLDFGCGWGFFTKFFAQVYPNIQVDGLDQDYYKIENAKTYRTLSNINYIWSEKIQEDYDSISVIKVLHEIKDVEAILTELNKHLITGGKIIIYDFRKASKEDFKKLYKQGGFSGTFEEEYEEHNKWTPKQFKELMEKADFKTIKIKTDGKHYLMYAGEKK